MLKTIKNFHYVSTNEIAKKKKNHSGIRCIVGGKVKKKENIFFCIWYYLTFVIFNNPAETIVIRSLNWSGSSCSFSSLNHLVDQSKLLFLEIISTLSDT